MQIITSSSLKLADVRFTPEELAKLRGEGGYIVTDPDVAKPDTMQGATSIKRKLKALSVDKITLPKIMYPSLDHILELDGRQYYMIHISKPNPTKNVEGTISLLDLETGEPSKRPFMSVADRIQAVKRDKINKSVEELNSIVKKWNSTIGKIQDGLQVVNPSTWPLQILWTENVINKRISELEGQEQAMLKKIDSYSNFSPAYSDILTRIKEDLKSGIIDPEDIYDTIMFVQHNDPDSIDEILESNSITEEVKTKIRGLIGIRNEAIEEKKRKLQENKTRLDDLNAPASEEQIEGMLSPDVNSLLNVDEQHVENYNPNLTPNSFYSPKGRLDQARAILTNVKMNKAQLTKVKSALDGMVEFLSRLSKGEKAKAVLTDPVRGTEIKKQIANFTHEANSFIRSYKTPVFTKNPENNSFQLNPKLLGTEGGLGNGAVSLALTHMVNVITGGLAAYASPSQPTQPNAVEQVPENVEDYMMQPSEIPNA